MLLRKLYVAGMHLHFKLDIILFMCSIENEILKQVHMDMTTLGYIKGDTITVCTLPAQHLHIPLLEGCW